MFHTVSALYCECQIKLELKIQNTFIYQSQKQCKYKIFFYFTITKKVQVHNVDYWKRWYEGNVSTAIKGQSLQAYQL